MSSPRGPWIIVIDQPCTSRQITAARKAAQAALEQDLQQQVQTFTYDQASYAQRLRQVDLNTIHHDDRPPPMYRPHRPAT